MKKRLVWLGAAVLLASSTAGARDLEDILKDKKVIDSQEANEVKAAKEKAQAPALPPLPDWISKVTFSGDVRIRNEAFFRDGDRDRNRDRFRLRFGVKAKPNDETEIGMRIASGATATATGTAIDSACASASRPSRTMRPRSGCESPAVSPAIRSRTIRPSATPSRSSR
jgi:hypothetical protein